jgi:hypothetical protein
MSGNLGTAPASPSTIVDDLTSLTLASGRAALATISPAVEALLEEDAAGPDAAAVRDGPARLGAPASAHLGDEEILLHALRG